MPAPLPLDNQGTDRRPEAWELDRIISLSKAVEVSSLCHDGWKRHHPDKLIRLSPRRIGIRLRDALMISTKS
jgi:hypothetical protein